jgi:hypothetical protein
MGLDTVLNMSKPRGPPRHLSQFLRSRLALSPRQVALRLEAILNSSAYRRTRIAADKSAGPLACMASDFSVDCKSATELALVKVYAANST